MPKSDWASSASIDVLRQRAGILARIREYFRERGVLEVETPVLSAAASTEVHLASYEVCAPRQARPCRYLVTSPEYHMKRLLASGSGAIYQISKAFRADEQGPLHNPEFTLLEWYRPQYTLSMLIDEVIDLVRHVFRPFRSVGNIQRFSYQDLFREFCALDPFTSSVHDLAAFARKAVSADLPLGLDDAAQDWLDLILTHVIEPQFRRDALVVVYDYPPGQASLARIRPGPEGALAERFEIYIAGIEIANGFNELLDAADLERRFAQDLATRDAKGLDKVAVDQHLIAALQHGLPACCGVALGVDRLIMLALESVKSVSEVIAFPYDRA